MPKNLNDICKKFKPASEFSPYGNGHINDTFYAPGAPSFIMQRINTNIFKSPDEVMENITNVTRHLSEKITAAGGNPAAETLTVVPTLDGKLYYTDEDGNAYRMYLYVENSVTHESAEKIEWLREAGRVFGRFQNMLDDFPAENLYTTIPKFHDTPTRVEQLRAAIETNYNNRREEAKEDIALALRYASYADVVTKEIEKGTVPIRVTHNDTKLNNILFDRYTDKATCVIDLDTVMPGSALYDFGDALRFGASSAAEDETDLSKVYFDLDKFRAYAEGFLSETASCLTETEIKLLPVSALLLTYECGIRFLADYLNGDTYFKIHREKHNLERARNQLALVCDIEKKLPEMEKIVRECLKK